MNAFFWIQGLLCLIYLLKQKRVPGDSAYIFTHSKNLPLFHIDLHLFQVFSSSREITVIYKDNPMNNRNYWKLLARLFHFGSC